MAAQPVLLFILDTGPSMATVDCPRQAGAAPGATPVLSRMDCAKAAVETFVRTYQRLQQRSGGRRSDATQYILIASDCGSGYPKGMPSD